MAESKRQLAGALEQLMEQKPLDQVRVSEIVALAGVSKQTFYHHFTDKYHLMEYCFRDMFSSSSTAWPRLRRLANATLIS